MEADESDGLAPPTPKPADALLSKFQEGARSQAPAQDGLHGPEVQAGACASDLSSAVIKSSGEMDELDLAPFNGSDGVTPVTLRAEHLVPCEFAHR